nr:unnamed protein product [Callosobruchus chinensis]
MILLYGECGRSVVDAVALYAEHFPDKNAYAMLFRRAVKQFIEDGTLYIQKQEYDEPRLLEDAILKQLITQLKAEKASKPKNYNAIAEAEDAKIEEDKSKLRERLAQLKAEIRNQL